MEPRSASLDVIQHILSILIHQYRALFINYILLFHIAHEALYTNQLWEWEKKRISL
jgi:hypothetical protein